MVAIAAAGAGLAEDGLPVDGVSGRILLHLLGAGVVSLYFGFGIHVLAFAGFELLHPGAGVHEEFGVVEAVLDEMQAAAVFFISGGEFLCGGIEMGLRLGE